jgi:hypothetical protein
VGRPFWREVGTAGHSCCWALPAQPSSGPSKFKLFFDWQSVGQSILVSDSHRGSVTRFLLLSDFCGLHVVGLPTCREDGSVICWYNSLWSHLTVSFETTWCPLRRLSWLTELWWRYSNPPPLGHISQSVSRYVLMSSPFWFSWPDVCYCLTVTAVSLWGALSEERSGLPIASQSLQYLVICQYMHKYLHFRCLTYIFVYIHYIQGLCQSWLSTAMYALLTAVHAAMTV